MKSKLILFTLLAILFGSATLFAQTKKPPLQNALTKPAASKAATLPVPTTTKSANTAAVNTPKVVATESTAPVVQPVVAKSPDTQPIPSKRAESKTTVVDFTPEGKVTVTKNVLSSAQILKQKNTSSVVADVDNTESNQSIANTETDAQTDVKIETQGEDTKEDTKGKVKEDTKDGKKSTKKSKKDADDGDFKVSAAQISAAKDDIASDDSGYHNCIWLDYLSAIGGFPSISYERVLIPKLTIALGGGITFNGIADNSLHGWLLEVFAPQFNDINEAYWAQKGLVNAKNDFLLTSHPFGNLSGAQKQLLGTYLFTEAKYYTNGEPFQGSYLAGRINYMRFNYEVWKPRGFGEQQYYNSDADRPKEIIYKTYLDVIPAVGFQRSRGNLVFDYEVGLGARIATAHAYNTAQLPSTTNNDIAQYRIVDQTAILPTFLLAFKMGYAF